MTEDALKRIEGGLAISLPVEYRETMLARGAELRRLVAERGRSLGQFIEASANQALITNCSERLPGMGTSEAYPKWWTQFFLIGTDGGGGYYCLRLDGVPGVWMIGSDNGDEPEKKFDSLVDYLDHFIKAAEK
jgi:hypothetical protein